MAEQKSEGQGPPQLSMEQYQSGGGSPQVQVTMAMAGQGQLPTLAPAPMQQGQMQGQLPSQPQGQQPMHGGGSPMQQNGQPQQQMMMPQTMGQPQFQVIQPSFNPGPGQYATYPQMAAFNSQGQLVLQPATQFLQPGQGGQQGQMILTSQLPPQKGQQHMISSGPGQQGKPMPGQPQQQQQQYVITSTGQLQMPPGQAQMPPVNLMLAPPGMPGGMQVSMSGQPGQPPVMKTSDGKPVASGQSLGAWWLALSGL